MVCSTAKGGVSSDDFSQILSDLGRNISWQKSTKAVDPQNGVETTTFATATNINVCFFLIDQSWIWEKLGLIAVGDAYVIAPKPALTISGTLSPNVVGTYTYAGTFNERNYYSNGTYQIFYYTAGSQWIIAASTSFVPASDPYWSLDGTEFRSEIGSFTPHNAATGTATSSYNTVEVGRYDKFKVDGAEYYVENTEKRLILGIDMFDYCVCFKVK